MSRSVVARALTSALFTGRCVLGDGALVAHDGTFDGGSFRYRLAAGAARSTGDVLRRMAAPCFRCHMTEPVGGAGVACAPGCERDPMPPRPMRGRRLPPQLSQTRTPGEFGPTFGHRPAESRMWTVSLRLRGRATLDRLWPTSARRHAANGPKSF